MLVLSWRNDRRAAREFELKIAMLQEQLDEIREKKTQLRLEARSGEEHHRKSGTHDDSSPSS
jgi:hypothetical protein